MVDEGWVLRQWISQDEKVQKYALLALLAKSWQKGKVACT